MAARVLVDANVLYRTRLRELLLALAGAGLLRPLWTRRILEEAASALVRGGRLAREEREGWIAGLGVPIFLVGGHEALEGTFALPDKDDEHVLAAAVHAGAESILTFNIRDFPARILKRNRLKAEMPDAFLARLLGQRPIEFLSAIEAARMTIVPAISASDHAAMLKRSGLPRMVKLSAQYKRGEMP